MRRISMLVAVGAAAAVLGAAGLTLGSVLSRKEATTNGSRPKDSELVTGSVWSRAIPVPAPFEHRASPAQGQSTDPTPTAQEFSSPSTASRFSVPADAQCGNSDALGISRTVEIDTAGGPGFGVQQYKAYDFLEPGEVVLTFDDGPWPGNTPAVLTALAAQCIKATFFPIGKHASWHPEILKLVVAEGHTVGSHTWSHANLAKKSVAEAKDEIENGLSAVVVAAGRPLAPFFRFPGLSQTPELMAYLAERNIGIFSTDLDSFDFKTKNPEQVIMSVMTKLRKRGKGIILMHDFQRSTAIALPALLLQLKSGGFKIVQLKAKGTVTTLPLYDAAMAKAQAGQTSDARPTASVVRTIEQTPN